MVGKIKKINVFVEIPLAVKVLLFLYWLIYTCYLQTYALIKYDGVTTENVIYVILSCVYGLVLYLPILAFKDVGLLHPLTLPAILNLLKSRLQSPISLVTDFFGADSIFTTSSRIVSKAAIVDANFKSIILNIVALIILYFSFYSVKTIKKKFKFNTHLNKKRLNVVVYSALLYFVVFFISQGGVKAYINSWGLEGGRAAVINEGGLGVFVSFLKTLYFIPVVWYLSTPGNSVFKNPLFIVSTVIFIFSGFLGSGSRSTVFSSLITLICIWILKNKTIPIKSLVIFCLVSIILFGMLGRLRSSATSNRTSADWSVLDFSDAGATQSIDYAVKENTKRNGESPPIACFAQVPETVDFLYGKSFASILTAYIPRSIWPNKPHSGAYYCGQMLFGVWWSIPIGGVSEVYWNFGYFGIIVLYFLWGRLLGYIACFYKKYGNAPGVATLYVIVLLGTGQISSLLFAGLLQQLSLVVLGLRYMKSI